MEQRYPPTKDSIPDFLAALAKYLLACCQHPDGGMRDKPPVRADFYHTLYSLAGLSATQHRYIFDAEIDNGNDGDMAFKWKVDSPVEGDKGDEVGTVHPLFVLPWGDAERIRRYFVR
jgi:protein farnesyltransferase subunit beta